MKLTHIFRLRTILAFLAGGLATLFFSILLETFLFRPIVKSTPALFPWNRELNALSLILASIIGGAVAVKGARSFSLWTLTKDEEEYPALLVVFAAAGVAVTLWLLRRVVADNPLTVGWRGIMMATAGAAAGGALVIGGRSRWLAAGALLVAVVIGFGTVDYDFYTYPVAIPSDRVLLRGEIVVPGRDAESTYPGVVLVHDWGQQDRNATWGINRPFRELAEHLARSGYVVLRYDKRGSGESSGVFTQFGLEDFATDVTSAASVLAAQDEVQGRPIFAVGHGYGGQAVTIAADERPELFAGLALINTPASPTADFLMDQQRRALSLSGASDEEIAGRAAEVNNWLEGVRSRRYLNYGDYFGSGGLAEELQAEQLQAPLPPAWVRQAEAHDQASALGEIGVPVLILAGDSDWRVPVSEAEALAEALAASGRSDWDLVIVPGMNHQLVTIGDAEAGFRIEQSASYQDERWPVAPALLDALADWLNRTSAN